MLERALSGGDRIRCVQHVEGEGAALYLAISEVELEGIVAKKGDSPYRAGRTRDWLKVKTPRFKSIEAIRLEPHSKVARSIASSRERRLLPEPIVPF